MTLLSLSDISTYLDQPLLRKSLGVDESIGNFTSCSNAVGAAFGRTQDVAYPTYLYVAQLLERGIKVLVYVGEYTPARAFVIDP